MEDMSSPRQRFSALSNALDHNGFLEGGPLGQL